MTRGHALIGAVCALTGCWSEEPLIDDTFTEDQWTFLRRELQLPQIEDCPERFRGRNHCGIALTFGRELFFDPALSGPVLIDDPAAPGELGETGTISCAGCHDPGSYFVDTRSQPRNVSIGAAAKRTKHNALSVLNLPYKKALVERDCTESEDLLCNRVFSWTGKYPTAGEVLLIAGPNAMNAPAPRVAITVRDNPSYFNQYVTLFDGVPPVCTPDPMIPNSFLCTCPPDQVGPCHTPDEVMGNVGQVFDAYLDKLTSTSSPFDRYLASAVVDGRTAPVDGFGDAEKRGLSVFIGKGMCIDCHKGPLLSDLKFHNTGVPQTGANVVPTDGGVGDEMDLDADVRAARAGQFLTPPLRHVAETAPYMHAGQLGTLAEVIEYYRRGGSPDGFVGIKDPRIQPLEIDDDEARDLESFLKSLTGPEDPFWAAP